MIRCVKIARYELRPADGDTYEYPASVASATVNPPTLEPKSLSFPGHVIFHSPLRRAVECIDTTGALRVEVREELKEVPFDMHAFCSREEWEREGSVIVRRKFKEAFVSDTLLLPRKEILDGVAKILEDAHAAEAEGPVVLVSHSFRLKVIEAYVKTGGKIASDPKLIADYIQDDKKTYGFGEGFEIEM